LQRTFTLRNTDGLWKPSPPPARPHRRRGARVRLRFVQKGQDSTPLREGRVDLETGVVDDTTDPTLHSRILFQDHWIGVVREGHPLSAGKISSKRFAGGEHILISRRGRSGGPVDEALLAFGLTRDIVTSFGGFSAAR
jgi:DNA-binding transcriptional LysR family regulator